MSANEIYNVIKDEQFIGNKENDRKIWTMNQIKFCFPFNVMYHTVFRLDEIFQFTMYFYESYPYITSLEQLEQFKQSEKFCY